MNFILGEHLGRHPREYKAKTLRMLWPRSASTSAAGITLIAVTLLAAGWLASRTATATRTAVPHRRPATASAASLLALAIMLAVAITATRMLAVAITAKMAIMLALAITISMALPMALKSAMTITTAMAFSAGGAVATPADTGKADSATSDGGKHEPRGRLRGALQTGRVFMYGRCIKSRCAESQGQAAGRAAGNWLSEKRLFIKRPYIKPARAV